MTFKKQSAVAITKDDVIRMFKSMPNWKGARSDKIQGFWLNQFTGINDLFIRDLNE